MLRFLYKLVLVRFSIFFYCDRAFVRSPNSFIASNHLSTKFLINSNKSDTQSTCDKIVLHDEFAFIRRQKLDKTVFARLLKTVVSPYRSVLSFGLLFSIIVLVYMH